MTLTVFILHCILPVLLLYWYERCTISLPRWSLFMNPNVERDIYISQRLINITFSISLVTWYIYSLITYINT